eukprot:TRINITY_DN16381_c0_g1_i1.p1 TRINITY_DN16381_c0_g1~~TRINITY_DN16381_c0_g1_i1.p1  ORF type:complete len:366 (+),score=78.77 TRINITY_DN16381_c0_g1_i1:55-1098(+)
MENTEKEKNLDEKYLEQTWSAEGVEAFSRDLRGATLEKMVEMTKTAQWGPVRGVIIHEFLNKVGELDSCEEPIAQLVEEVIVTMLAEGVGNGVSGICKILQKFKSVAELGSSPVMGELIRALQDDQSGLSPDILPLLMLANSVIDAFPVIPSEVSQELTEHLSSLPAHTAVKNEANILLNRLAHTPLQPPVPGPSTPTKSDSDKSYTETEVKSFLYQRKLDWENQLRKRDRVAKEHLRENAELKAEVVKVRDSLVTCQEMITLREGKVEELERQIEVLHHKNLEVENKLEDNVGFLREKEHQISLLEEKVEKLDTENTILGNENRSLSENNRELRSYVAELIDRTEK